MAEVSRSKTKLSEAPCCKCQKKLADALKKLEKSEKKLKKARKYNKELNRELDELKEDLRASHRTRRVKKTRVGTQTDVTWLEDTTSAGDNSTVTEVVSEPVYEPLQQGTGGTEETSIADQLRAAAEQAISQSDYTYDESSGLYYDGKTGYYYNPENKLYYDSINYCYYTLNEQTNEYEFHSQADISQYEQYYKHQQAKEERLARQASRRAKREARLAKEEQKTLTSKERRDVDQLNLAKKKRRKDAAAEDGRSESASTTEEGELMSSEEDAENLTADRSWNPPCVRAIVLKSDSLDVASLHVITISGGNIGSANDCVIRIAEEDVSESHCKVMYSEEQRSYYLVELGSQSGTFINSQRLSLAGEIATVRISNRDKLVVGSTELVLHVHPGTDTCADCEPGLVDVKLKAAASTGGTAVKSKADIEKDRRSQLKSIKKKYGLEKEKYKQGSVNTNGSKYEDKAGKRRKEHGLELPGVPDAPAASVDSAISTQNKGHKLLEKMGWQSGQSLGKSNTGIVEPVKVNLRLNASAGLGSQANSTLSMDDAGDLPKARRKAELSLKVQKRFQQANAAPLFNLFDDEEDEIDNQSQKDRKS